MRKHLKILTGLLLGAALLLGVAWFSGGATVALLYLAEHHALPYPAVEFEEDFVNEDEEDVLGHFDDTFRPSILEATLQTTNRTRRPPSDGMPGTPHPLSIHPLPLHPATQNVSFKLTAVILDETF